MSNATNISNISGDSLKRQTSINEWYYKYRLDMLFVFQVLFLGLSIIILMTIFSKYHIISPVFVVFTSGLIFLFVFLVWYFRYAYNKNTRDFNQWDKRRFPSDGQVTSPITADVKLAMSQILANGCKN